MYHIQLVTPFPLKPLENLQRPLPHPLLLQNNSPFLITQPQFPHFKRLVQITNPFQIFQYRGYTPAVFRPFGVIFFGQEFNRTVGVRILFS